MAVVIRYPSGFLKLTNHEITQREPNKGHLGGHGFVPERSLVFHTSHVVIIPSRNL